ncbi:uncharacterized protein LOC117809835 [Xyrichtys novacula]|uniref:Uncharacterized protein LOC117809835 n=1 Tax=Xyrichtys novacula TaxID=13765 RepID=A0AAV1FXN1_XYRNO|nr:uncharacterized protein LOC117809835 [Xyrichtys novacula]
MQNQNTDRIIPKVRYHPTIQMPGNKGQIKTPQTQKARPSPVRTPQTRIKVVHQILQVDPSVRPCLVPNSGPKPANTPDQKSVQRSDTNPPLMPAQVLGEASFTPDQIPVGVEVQLDRRVVEEVESLTRGQRTNQKWFNWRKNRITASVAHRIAHCRFVNGRSKTPPISYIDDIAGERRRIQTRAMTWGINREAEVVRKYQGLKSAELGRSVTVRDCGLFIDSQRSWLAATPDGIVMDSLTGQWLICLEVKCPYKHRNSRVEDACREDKAFCLEIQDEDRVGQKPVGSPVYCLKKSHSYYTQIQCQLAVTGLQQADLVVYTLKETAIVPVTFDPDLWEETVSKLEVFYRKAFLPLLREKTQKRPAVAVRPEL